MRRIFITIILIGFIPFIYAFVVEAFKFLSANVVSLLLNWMTYGFILYLVLYVFFLRAKVGFFETFEHELAHTVVALLFFRNIQHFIASKHHGGQMAHLGAGNSLIALALYFFPVFTIPFLIIKPFATAAVHQTVDFFLGLTLAFHFASLFKEFGPWQSDITHTGMRNAIAVVIFLNTLFTVLTFSFAFNKYDYFLAYSKQGLLTALHTYQAIGGFINRFLVFLNQIMLAN